MPRQLLFSCRVDEEREWPQVLVVGIEHQFRMPLYAEDIAAVPHDDGLDQAVRRSGGRTEWRRNLQDSLVVE